MADYLVEAKVWLKFERGPRPSKAQVAQAVADRLGDGAYHLHVNVAPGPEGTEAFGGARLVPTKTQATEAEPVGESDGD